MVWALNKASVCSSGFVNSYALCTFDITHLEEAIYLWRNLLTYFFVYVHNKLFDPLWSDSLVSG